MITKSERLRLARGLPVIFEKGSFITKTGKNLCWERSKRDADYFKSIEPRVIFNCKDNLIPNAYDSSESSYHGIEWQINRENDTGCFIFYVVYVINGEPDVRACTGSNPDCFVEDILTDEECEEILTAIAKKAFGVDTDIALNLYRTAPLCRGKS